MKNIFPIIAIATLLLSSCSSTIASRTVAHEVIPETNETLESLFTIKASNMSLAEEDLEKEVLNHLMTFAAATEFEVALVEDDQLINESIFKIEPVIDNNKHLLVIKHAKDAFRDHAATLNLTRFMDSLLQSKAPSLSELYYKAQSNDPLSLQTVAKIRRLVLTPLETSTYYESINLSQYNGYIQGETIFWDKKLAEIVKKKNAKKSETPKGKNPTQ